MKAEQSANPGIDEKVLKGYADQIRATGKIDPALYEKYNVKRGLRNSDGTGVLVGLTTPLAAVWVALAVWLGRQQRRRSEEEAAHAGDASA